MGGAVCHGVWPLITLTHRVERAGRSLRSVGLENGTGIEFGDGIGGNNIYR